MMYYIERPKTCRAVNRKIEELLEFVNHFQYLLIADDLSRDALIEDIRTKVKELNAAYPRTKKLEVKVGYKTEYIICKPEERLSDCDTVFTICFLPVRKHYRFSEKANVLEEGGNQ